MHALPRRCVVQLSVLGYILVPIFTAHKWYIVLGYAVLMALVGAYEAASRPAYTFRVHQQVVCPICLRVLLLPVSFMLIVVLVARSNRFGFACAVPRCCVLQGELQ